jgi:hypothetical protein
VPQARAEALVMLAENAFNFHDHGRQGLDTLARLVRGCATHHLEMDDLAEACAAVRRLLAATRT